MMVWEYFTHFHKSALCYTDVHVHRATSLDKIQLFCFKIDVLLFPYIQIAR